MKNLFIPKPHEVKLMDGCMTTDNLINKYVLFNEN